MTDYNLPPGVSISDIPGNRPEDEAWDKLYEETILGYCDKHSIGPEEAAEIWKKGLSQSSDSGDETLRRKIEELRDEWQEQADFVMEHGPGRRAARELQRSKHLCVIRGIDETAALIDAHPSKAVPDSGDVERMTDALERILQWAGAYPIDVFIPPTSDEMKRANEILAASGISYSAINAHVMRHVVDGVRGIAEQGLAAKTGEPKPE